MHVLRSRWVGFLLAATWLIASPADASPRTYIKSICLSPEILEVDLLEVFTLPVGCELIDCCPGCPAADALDWRIRIGGKSVEAATLSFEGLADPAALKVEGAAELTPDGATLMRGRSRLLNLTLPEGGRVPMAGLRLRLDPDFLGHAAGSGRRDETLDVVEVSIEQMLGSVAVNEFLLRYRNLEGCASTPIIVVTAMDLADEDRERLAGGVERIIEKGGLTKEQLLAHVQSLVASHEAQKTETS